jgi:hypothetical protein
MKQIFLKISLSLALVIGLIAISAPSVTYAASSQADCPSGTTYAAPAVAGRAGTCDPTTSTPAPTPTGAAAAVPQTPQPNSDGTYTLCGPRGDCTTTGSLENAIALQQSGYTQSLQDAQAQQKARFNAPDSCSGTIMQWTDPFTCLWRSLLSALGAGLVWLVSWLVTAAGMFFNWSIKVTVINFTGLFYTPAVNEAVGQVWTNLRDLANIFIIGLFVFIAISIILGLQEFGQKKLIARVVVVAILINFSFLFTQIAINASNFFAAQIIAGKAQELPISGTSAAAGVANNTFASSGVAGEFLKFAGAETFGDTFDALRKTADKNESAWLALLHGIMAAILLTLAAATLFYGGMLLLARGVIFLFLIMTSAFAFATYLSPALAESDYGFKGWKNQLMRNVMLAPAMMIFLWATLKLAKPLSANGTLGSLLTNPSGEAGIGALFSYLLIIGLLFGSLKLSSSLAGASGRLALSGAMLGLNIPSKALAWAGRRYIGGAAASSAHDKQHDMDSLRDRMNMMAKNDPRRSALESKWMSLSRQKGRRESLAKSSFDMANLKPVQKLNAAAGLGGVFGKSDASFEKSTHESVKKAMDEAMKVAMTDEKARGLARKQYEDRDGLTAEDRTHRDNERLLKAVEEGATAQKNAEKLLTGIKEQRDVIASGTAEKTKSAEKFARGEIDRSTHEANLRREDARIEEARTIAGHLEDRAAKIDQELGVSNAKSLVAASAKARTEFEKRVAEEGKQVRAQSVETAVALGKRKVGGNIYAGTGYQVNPLAATEVVQGIRSKTNPARMKKAEQKKWEKEDSGKDEHHGPAPAAGGGAAPAH